MKDNVRFWTISAERDLDECLNPFIKYVEHVCFNAHQATEKILKAALTSENISFDRSHDLDYLRNLLPNGWSIKNSHPDLSRLSKYAIESRYSQIILKYTTEDGTYARSTAKAVFDSVYADMNNRGVL